MCVPRHAGFLRVTLKHSYVVGKSHWWLKIYLVIFPPAANGFLTRGGGPCSCSCSSHTPVPTVFSLEPTAAAHPPPALRPRGCAAATPAGCQQLPGSSATPGITWPGTCHSAQGRNPKLLRRTDSTLRNQLGRDGRGGSLRTVLLLW